MPSCILPHQKCYSNPQNIKQNQSNIDRRPWTFREWQINLPRILRFWSMHQSEVMWILVTWGSQAVSRVGRGQKTFMTFHQLHHDSYELVSKTQQHLESISTATIIWKKHTSMIYWKNQQLYIITVLIVFLILQNCRSKCFRAETTQCYRTL